MTNISDVIVVGGGIGGLATALSIVQRTDKTVAVLEQAPAFGEIGAGIQLAPNALHVLDQLGVKEEILNVAVVPKRLVLKDIYTAKELAVLDLTDGFQERFKQPYVVLHRSDLHRVLYEACLKNNRISFKNDEQIQTVSQTPGQVTITNQRGESYTAEAAIGADGIKSNVRKLFSQDEMICSEYVAYRGTLPIEEITAEGDIAMDDVIMWIGPNLHLVQYPVRRGELYNQVVVFKTYDYKPEGDWGTPEEMQQRFEGAHPDVERALKYISTQFRWPMFHRLPIENWTDENVTLLGDAAHPMLQYLAQGGAQALEDAYVLGEALENEATYNEAFLRYQKERQPRSAMVQNSARRWGEIIHADTADDLDRALVLLRDHLFGSHKETNYDVADFLYNYFNTRKSEVKS
ncbi:salicylate hydroxylase [Solibacillus kalamii]|uniref:3-hydroxybenzoate 6-hydroxylase n=1 Tax=Solibacillus kalamii TaxID=1748298 RepID=A0ABX3ZHI9_9BACL|nr:FAD-dependent monooxygenase [Solibacillus kalamii]MBM7665375.1 salicylate hydroxylase [Solibacillus kalamii]OUZ39207.1 3-hydroxybenzoate 6-hydroxylase [Solibacillus kalamii]